MKTILRIMFVVVGIAVGATAGQGYVHDYQYERFKCDFYGQDHEIIFKGLVVSAKCVTVFNTTKGDSNGTQSNDHGAYADD